MINLTQNAPVFIKSHNLSAVYKNSKCPVLDSVSFEIESGKLVCLCGPNGAGKSTLLSILAGIQNPALSVSNPPSIILDSNTDLAINSLKRKECARLISYMAQTEQSIWDFTVQDIVMMGRYPWSNNGLYSEEDFKITQQIIEEMELTEFADRSVHSLSGGEFQKVRIARSLAQEPRFLILDEPAANLDFVYEPKLMQLLQTIAIKKNIGVLISIHNINLAADFAHKVIMLPKNGKALFGDTEKIFTLENLDTTFGVNFSCTNRKSFQLSL